MPSDTQMLEQVCYHPCGQEAEHHDRHRPRCVEIVNRLFAVPQVVSDIHQVVLSIDASFPLAERSRSEQRRPKTRQPGRSDACHLRLVYSVSSIPS